MISPLRLATAGLLAALLAASSLPLSAQNQIPAPEKILGFKPGADGMLAGYSQIRTYFQKLAAASDRVELRTVGKTTQGRPFDVAFISSPANLRDLDRLRRDNAALADPRTISRKRAREIISKGKAFVLINESIHSSEVGPAQAGMVTAHFLASTKDAAWIKVLDEAVVLLTICHNPDGYDIVVDWWNETKGDPATRGAPLPVVYNEYVGPDNNRDWFMLTQRETRITVDKLHMTWHPQIVVDQHQMGGRGARMFVPPYIEPYEPNVHPLLKTRLREVGSAVRDALIASGHKGVWSEQQFDGWTPARAFMHYHGAARFLTEVASASGADPVEVKRPIRGTAARKSKTNPDPWLMGRWALADIVDYTSQGALNVLRHVAENRRKWLDGFYRIHKDNTDGKQGPAGFIVPAQANRAHAVRKLLDIMQSGGVECEPIDGSGFLIRNGQPYFCFARALLENTPYPEVRLTPGGPIRRPYDVTCHNLPLLMNLRVETVLRGGKLPPQRAPLQRRNGQLEPLALAPSNSFLLPVTDAGSLADVLRAVMGSARVGRLTRPDGSTAYLISSPEGSVRIRSATVVPKASVKPTSMKRIRVGIYRPWTGSMDEGWTRFLFDFFELPFVSLTNEDFRQNRLAASCDVIVFADFGGRGRQNLILVGRTNRRLTEKYRGGIGEKGRQALRSFVEEGGRLIALNSSTRFARETFNLPLEEVRTGSRVNPRANARGRFNVPGAMLNTEVNMKSPIAPGCTPVTPVFFWRARAFKATGKKLDRKITFPVKYARKNIRAGGFAEGADVLSGHAAVAVARVGKGKVILFGFSPQFRCQTWGTFPLFFNSILSHAVDAQR